MNPIATNLQNFNFLFDKSRKTLEELKELHNILKNVYICENKEVKPYKFVNF